MASHFRYVLVLLIFFLIYEIYLIGYYEYQQYQTNSYVDMIESINRQTLERNEKKQDLTAYIVTPAYQTYVAKATQNRKLPGEEVTTIVDESSLRANEEINVNAVISAIQQTEISPTRNMTNPEKWNYILRHLRDYIAR